MKDIRIHKQWDLNLSSIKPIDNTYGDRKYLEKLFFKYNSQKNYNIGVYANRSTYECEFGEMRDKIINEIGLGSVIKLTENIIQLHVKKTEINYDVYELLTIVWFAYEQVTFCFSKEKIDFENRFWKEIISRVESYVFFKGAEEDVIWIGKSSTLDYIQ